MSVRKNERGVSKLQYLNTAYYLQEFTAERSRKLISTNNPLSILTSNMLMSIAMDITNNTKVASLELFKDSPMRREALEKAYASLNIMVSQIGQAHSLYHFSDNIMTEWNRLILEDINFILIELGHKPLTEITRLD